MLNGCEKDVVPQIKQQVSFTEEFDTVANLYYRGWIFSNNSQPLGTATWQQGIYTSGKLGLEGFPAFSYHSSSDEYIYAGFNTGNNVATLSSWMITPVIEMKDGDKFYFYTRTTAGSTFADRLQVRINTQDNSGNVGNSATSIGSFTNLVADINANYATGQTGYPQGWRKYEYTISGFEKSTKSRIALRYFVENGGQNGSRSNAIGIDQFHYESL
jgi:hypothetical protein